MMKLKDCRSSPHNLQSVFAIIFAVLGELYKSAISPKVSPVYNVLIKVSLV